MTVSEALVAVRARIDAAAEDAGRDPRDVTLVVVTKSVAVDAIREVLAAGVTDVGENRAQDLVAKARALGADGTGAPRWHFIGRLQRNKVRTAAPYVALWQSVDRHELATEIARRAPGARVLVQGNVAGEEPKGGCAPADTAGLVARCRAHGLDDVGLMRVPPDGADPTPIFETLRRLSDELGLATCSMGMSGDYERAIRAGATMVRVGSAIFGPRPADSDARR
jgi:pyridoxal phosphate enzyme (YggS family)